MNIKAARRSSGLTRAAWAKALGVNVSVTKRWEKAPDAPYHRAPTERRIIAIEQLLTRQGINLAEVA
ncbi:helix-turn-helix domain-containing protein [Sphingobium chungbukense]|uniref:HTH cro/C1-type domain-containing protein n=1 Tax=Sphingobium chungbukense TaxID=56193 RepID=A0A0M3AY89_9SPHN|nr:helix-turn-helix transcriptional regulator [Sphingobium chungbukense]KKW93881.1 hypothetical protein YP76_04310 [Sphingobium chungbukense]